MKLMQMKISKKILIYLLILVSILLVIPSIRYLIVNKTVDGFDFYYTYNLQEFKKSDGIKSAIIVIGLVIIYSIGYVLIIKHEKSIFNKNLKDIMKFIIIISFIFMLIMPFLSSDIFYYIGDNWLASKYHKNPYYTTVSELQESGITDDEILNNTGYWKDTVSVYGPLYNSMARVLVSLSFGNLTLALLIFKIASYIIHLINCYFIYKITKNTKHMIIYGLNPLVLLELLSNVHNDIYVILFIILALYFLMRLKNIPFTIIFLALSISIKYSSILIVPFILLYIFRKKNILKKLMCCIGTGLIIIAIVIVLYLPYYRDITIFTNMLVQTNRYSQSIILLLSQKISSDIVKYIDLLKLPIFAIMYATVLICFLIYKDISLRDVMRKYNFFMLIFIFLVLTNFQKWYILWILPTYAWQKKWMKKFILALTLTAILPSWNYFITGGDSWQHGMWYSTLIIITSVTYVVLHKLYIYDKKKENNNKEIKKANS